MNNIKRYVLLVAFTFILTAVFGLGATNIQAAPADDLVITGVYDGPLSGGTPKGVELYALNAIPDLSVHGIGSANNGGGSDGEEFTFPAIAVPAGTCIYVASESTQFANFFGFAPDYVAGAMSINGDDAIELFANGAVSDVFGDINVDGTGEAWDHVDGWAYRNSSTGPDGSTFTIGNWSFSGPNALDGESSNATAATPVPIGTYAPCATVEAAPTVSSSTPADGDSNVAIDADITVAFSEDVVVTANWFDISCASSGAHTAVPSGGPQAFTLNPDTDFDNGESCTVTVIATEVSDVDTDDPPDNMDADYVATFTTITVSSGGWVINEISADPDAVNGDANRDGTVDTSEDEFVEIVNISGEDVDISGWTIADAVAVRHTFPTDTIVSNNCAILVFGGGTPSTAFGDTVVQTASGGFLGFNNGGDTVTLNDGSSDQATASYGSEGGNNQSLTLDPDITGASLVQHTTATGSGGGLFSPGTQIDGSSFSGCGSEVAVQTLLLSEVIVTPTGGEFVEIYNPNGTAVDLTNVYLSDATFAGGGTYYYNIVTGSNSGGGSFSDFHARFPDGATIASGEYQTVALAGSDAFFVEYGIDPTYELYEDGAGADSIPDMREATAGSINNQGGLTNGGEIVVLYYWDGASDLVTDLDYVVWGDTNEAFDKTGVALDGPDADTDTSAYQNDTPLGSQIIINSDAHEFGNSWQRDDYTEGAEVKIGGNGAEGHDETSEDLNNTWCENTPTPNASSSCLGAWIINEFQADPDATNGDANGDGTVNTSQDEFVEIVNNSGSEVDISGWTIADGFGVRHTFPANSSVPNGCAVVIFAGGTPTGSFGSAVVQTASSGSLGLNNSGDSITLNDGSSDRAGASYGSEGGDNQSLTLDPDIAGTTFVKHSVATSSGGTLFSPGTQADGTPFTGCPLPPLAIYEIQGSGTASPYAGQTVSTMGVVVAAFQGSSGLNGFFIQTPDADADADVATSNGIFVYDPSGATVAVGDYVEVTGSVTEFWDLTEINNVSSMTIVSSGNPLPTATAVSLPEAVDGELEQYEGMLVEVVSPMTVSQNFFLGRYGQMTLSANGRLYQPTNQFAPGSVDAMNLAAENARRILILDDGQDITSCGDNPVAVPYIGAAPPSVIRAGDSVSNLIGVLDYGRINSGSPCSDNSTFNRDYRLHPTAAPVFTPDNPRTAAPDAVGGSLQVASFNVLNYFTTIDTGSGICGPSGNFGCRGADSASELARQQDKIVAALAAMDADIVGLIELENNAAAAPAGDGVDPVLETLVAALNTEIGGGTYSFVDAGVIGTDAIKVAFIYDTTTVALSGDFAILDSSVDPAFIDTKNRPALAQTFVELSSGGELTIAVNHLKSKGSPCDDVGDPTDPNGQGNCNGTRTAAAQALADWLATDPTGSGDADFLIMGDLNAYAQEDPITTLEAAGYTNLILDGQGSSAYSYIFDGQSGYLDHAMANSDLHTQVTGITEWHINGDEPSVISYDENFNPSGYYSDDAYRASDHDPVIIGLNMHQQCNGVNATIFVNSDGFIVGGPDNGQPYMGSLRGTNGDDVIRGTDGIDNITGRNGDDLICGGANNDRILAGNGHDVVFGDEGDDVISGFNHNDILFGGAGNDFVHGGRGQDVISGDSGNDIILGHHHTDNLSGGDGEDIVVGGHGRDTLLGDADDDILFGGFNSDSLAGGSGDDLLIGGFGRDLCDGGVGTDTAVSCEGLVEVP